MRGDGGLAAGSWLRGRIGGLGMRDANREGERGEVVYWSRVRR